VKYGAKGYLFLILFTVGKRQGSCPTPRGESKDGLPVVAREAQGEKYTPGKNIFDLRTLNALPTNDAIDPDYTIEGFALPLFGWMKYLRLGKLASGLAFNITEKIAKQLAKRGWSEELVERAINKAFTTRPALNKATGKSSHSVFFKRRIACSS
jgi:Colicin E5 ribonuclease domain